MKPFKNTGLALLFAATAILPSCKKEIGSLNSPIIEDFENASKSQLNNLVSGTESGLRNNYAMYLDVVGTIGREMYRFSQADPRYVTDLLGGGSSTLNNNTFYLTNPWASRYRVVKNCNILIDAASTSTLLTDAERKGYLGFAKTIKAYQLLLNLNLTYTNGIRIDVDDPDQLGPIVDYPNSLAAIASLLDEAKTDLAAAPSLAFLLSSGFTGFNTPAGLIKFNRAIAARVHIYRNDGLTALGALNESFFDLNGPFGIGVYHVYTTGSGDQLNDAFFPQNQNGEIRLAQPAFATDIIPGDDRIAKATLRTATATSSGLSSNRDIWIYQSPTDPVPMIRNEELILIYAEAKIKVNQFPDAIVALNRIRTQHNQTPYAGAITEAALTNELLYQRRYSLFFEGHRWVDMRRYNRLNQLPKDRPDDDVWEKFPLPLTEEF